MVKLSFSFGLGVSGGRDPVRCGLVELEPEGFRDPEVISGLVVEHNGCGGPVVSRSPRTWISIEV